MPVPQFDHQDPRFVVDPYPVLRRLQDEAPVFWSEAMSSWVVTRYDDVRQGLRDPRMSADRIRPFVEKLGGPIKELVLPLAANLQLWAVFNDPPQHTRLRALMNKAFTSRAVEALRPRIARIVDELLDEIAAGGAGEFDFHKRFAYPLPASVIADMLGVPRGDVTKLKHWSDDLAQFVLTSRANPDKYRRAAQGMAEMTEYFSDFIRRREREGGGDDVTAAMLAARERDDKLSHDEIVASALLLLFAGHETTTQLLANGLLALLRHPDQLADLRRNLDDAALVRNTVEELMRFDGPSLSMVRVAGEAFDWAGEAIGKGDRVFLFISGANHDRRAFLRPEVLDIRRAEAKNQIGFGFGIHFCLGAPLARLEAEIAFPRILKRFPALALADPDPPWSDSILTRGMLAMRVRV
jgi:cytochrome P450